MEGLGRGTERAKPPECKVVFYLHNVKELRRLWLWLLWAQRRGRVRKGGGRRAGKGERVAGEEDARGVLLRVLVKETRGRSKPWLRDLIGKLGAGDAGEEPSGSGRRSLPDNTLCCSLNPRRFADIQDRRLSSRTDWWPVSAGGDTWAPEAGVWTPG